MYGCMYGGDLEGFGTRLNLFLVLLVALFFLCGGVCVCVKRGCFIFTLPGRWKEDHSQIKSFEIFVHQ